VFAKEVPTEPGRWRAQWIGGGGNAASWERAVLGPVTGGTLGILTNASQLTNLTRKVDYDGRSLLLRKEFVIGKPLMRAMVRVTGLGYFEFYCNGERVGDQVLAPAHSNYRKSISYETFDLTSLLHPGTNAIGLMIGNGWFNSAPKWWDPYRMPWFGAKRGWAQLDLEFTDGSKAALNSDGSWTTAPGPVMASCVYDGETYDATAERPGWAAAGYDDSQWTSAQTMEKPGGELQPRQMPPIRVIEHLVPAAITEPKSGVYVVDFGQNFAGWMRLKANGPRGTRITLRHAEDLKSDGMIDPTSNERAAATDVYVMSGQGVETYEPRFTFHGFRYVEVTGYPGVPTPESFLGCVVHSACEVIGDFECDNELINRIHRATVWSQRGNLMGYPMDCPQRDERLGWFGDALVTMEEAMFNFDMADFYRHWLAGVRSDQNEANGDISILAPRPYLADEPDPTWSSAYLVMLWQFYLHYGDRRILAEHFESMRRYVDFLGSQAQGHILPKYWIGDWGTTVKGWKEGEPVSVTTAFYYYDTVILAKTARVLGKLREARKYEALARSIKRAFSRAYYRENTGNYESGTQFANAFPLFLGLAPTGRENLVLQNILSDLERHGGHFTVGVLGTKYLIDALTQRGRADIAFRLVNQTGFPSWAHLLEGGRTTLSEFWDLHGSHNHVMLGSIDAWFYRTLAGIMPDEARPGFEHFYVSPFIPDSLHWVRASTRTVRGRIAVEWRKQAAGFELKVTVPPGSRATVILPARYSRGITSRPPVPVPKSNAEGYTIQIGAGSFTFQAAAE
jgi:alpha-L-rhamnosidase